VTAREAGGAALAVNNHEMVATDDDDDDDDERGGGVSLPAPAGLPGFRFGPGPNSHSQAAPALETARRSPHLFNGVSH